jgi:large subunit ribosomal protein L9
MELLLLEDIPGIGVRNDIVVVSNGFALNNLLPRRRALVATPAVRKRYAEQIRRRAEEKLREADLARSASAILTEKAILFARKVNEAGKLYASISEKDISDALSEQLEIEVAEADVKLTDPIKATGTFAALIRIGDQDLEAKVEVKAEK